MNPKLEELRKRFLPSTPFVPTPETIFRRESQVSQPPGLSEQLPAANSAEPAEARDALTAQSSPQTGSLAERATDNRNGQVAVEESKSVDDQLGQAIAKLFEPAQRCKEHLAEIANASDSIFQLVGSALERLEELESFHDHMRRLSNSFASMRAFQDDLGVLAESFEPVKALHQQVIRLADAVRTHLAEVAASLEPANALRAQTAELTQILGVGTELLLSAGRSQTAAPPPVGSSPPHTPLAAPARTVPRLSSLRPLPILAEDLLLPDFCSGALTGPILRRDPAL